ncbi:RND transporter [Methylogaea oryzae]|uniref:RND transporter n=2 Tax=Methylogaea oryzae TaxID=1295382 RepID=A0A8D5AIK5_9GAMM|nr:RND transporter [Methylogaea oryzae]
MARRVRTAYLTALRGTRCVPYTLTALLAGCAVGPDYQAPRTPLPERWHESQAPAGTVEAAWWKTFRDPMLEKLMEQAAAGNLDYRQALDRIGAARAQRTMAVAAGLPSLSARSSINRRRNSFGGSPGANTAGSTSASTTGFGGAGRTISNIFQAGFDAAWEIDVFGGIRRGVEAAEADLEAERENSRNVLVTLFGDVARSYIDLRVSQQLAAISRDNLQAQEEVLRLTRVRSQAGLASELDVAQAESVVANTRAQLPTHELAAKQAIHALGVLLGREPDALAAELSQPGAVPAAAGDATADLPSDLLRRRPDLRAAERKLASATAQIGVATADLYPKFNLTSWLGLQNPNLMQVTPVGKSWAMGAAATMPLFNWGRIRANIEAKEAQRDELLHAYQSAVLNALQDVEDALAAHYEDRRRGLALEQADRAADTAVQLAMERYRKGLTSFMDVLDAERSLFTAQSQLAQNQAQVAADLVALYKALGGGWQALEKTAE